MGSPADALASLSTAVKLEPSNLRARGDAMRMHALLGDYAPVDDLVARAAGEAGTEGVVIVLAARLALWKRDVALLRRIEETTKDLQYAFKSAVGELVAVGVSGNITPAMADLGKTWGKVTVTRLKRI